MLLEGTWKVAQKQKKSVKKKQFQSIYEDSSVVSKRKENNIGRDVEQILVDDSLRFFLLSLSLSIPLDWELNRSLSDRGCRAAGQSGCLSCVFARACPSALVSAVVHGGRDAGDYRGASSCCKVTCDSWTYRRQEERDDSVNLWCAGKTGLLMMLYTRKMDVIGTDFDPVMA